jgi:hypothetical protein
VILRLRVIGNFGESWMLGSRAYVRMFHSRVVETIGPALYYDTQSPPDMIFIVLLQYIS